MQNSARNSAGYFSRRSGSYRKKYTALFLPYLLVSTIFFFNGTAHAYTSPGTPSGYVNDFANVIREPVESELQEILRQYAASTTNEIAVTTVKTIGDDYIENYAVELFKEWGVGSKKNDNGVLILIATDDRQLRIEVGYGLEGAIPDSVADRIIRETMVPSLKEGDYDNAAMNGVLGVMEAARNEYVADSQPPSQDALEWFGGLFIFAILALQWLLAILARTKSWWLGGIIGLVVGIALSSVFSWWFVFGAMLTVGLTVFGLFFDYVISSTYSHAKKYNVTPPWWSGGSGGLGGGFGGRGGGGFGGFGGGHSGGGGASGRW